MPNPNEPAPSPRRQRSPIRWILIAGGILVLAILLLVALAPTLVSTGWGTRFIERTVARSGAGALTLEHLRLSWRRGVQARGIAYRDASGTTEVNVDAVDVDTPLWRLASGRRDLGTVRIERPVIRFAAGPSQPAPAPPPTPTRPRDEGVPSPRGPAPGKEPRRLPFRGKLLVADGEIEVAHADFEPVILRDLSVELDAQSPGLGIPVSVSATAQQGALTGSLSAKGRIAGFNNDGSFSPSQLRAEGVLEAVGLPVEGIDTLVEADGWLAAAVGDRIDLRLSAGDSSPSDGDTAANRPMFLLEVASSRLNGTVKIAAQNERIAGDGELRWTVAPEFAARLAGTASAGADTESAAAGVTLAGPVDVRLRLASFSTTPGPFRPDRTAFEIAASVDNGAVDLAEDLGILSWSGVEATVASSNLADVVDARLQASLSSGAETGTIQGQVALSHLFAGNAELRPEGPDFDGGLMLRDMPTPLIDRIVQAKGVIRDALGPALNLSVTALRKEGEPGSVRLFADSAQAQLRAPLRLADRIGLESPATLRWTAGPEMQSRLSKDPALQLALGEPITLTVETLDAPVPRNGAARDWAGDTRVSARLEAGGIDIRMAAKDGQPERRVSADNLDVRLQAESLLDPKATLTSTLRLGNAEAPETIALGEELSAELSVHASLGKDFRPDTVDVVGTARSEGGGPLRTLEFEGRVANGLTSLELTKPAQAVYVLSPQRYDRLMGDEAGRPRLRSDAEFSVVVDSFETSLSPFSPSALRLAAQVSSSRVELEAPPEAKRLDLEDMRMTVLADGAKNSMELRIEAKAAEAGARETGSIVVTDVAGPWIRDNAIDLGRASHEVSLTAQDLPTALVDAFAGSDGLLPPLLGPSLALQANIRSQPAGETTVEVQTTSDLLRASAELAVDERSGIAARAPVAISWTCTPDAYARLTRSDRSEGAATLLSSVEVDATIDTFRVPRRSSPTGDRADGPAFDISKASLHAALRVGPASWRVQDTGDRIAVEDLVADVSGETLNEARIRASGAVRAVTAQGETVPGKLDVDTRLANLFTPSGALNAETLSVDARVRAEELPLEMLRALGQSPDFAAAAFGDRVSMDVDAEIEGGNGPVEASLQSGNASAAFKGRYGDGRITLAEPMVAQLTVTEQLGSLVLSRLHPIFKTAQTADRPLTLTIPQEGVVIPIANFQLRDVSIPAMRWDLGSDDPETGEYAFGTLQLKTGGLLGGLLSFAQQRGKLQGRRTDVITVRMTPMVLRLQNGTLDYGRRLDLLVDDAVRLVTWGQVGLDTDPDTTRDASNVQLFLGIPGRTLDDVFGLDGVAPNEMFTVPIRGTTTGAKIDWQAAAADMATLQAKLRLIKDPLAGALVRQVLRELLGGKAPPAPPPSLALVPWLQPAPGTAAQPPPEQTTQDTAEPPSQQPPAKPDPLGDALRGILGNL